MDQDPMHPSGSRLYVIGPDDGPFKIGITSNITSRLSTLQSANARKLKVHVQVKVPEARTREFEAAIHAELAPSRIAGEWFDVSVDDIVAVIFNKIGDDPVAETLAFSEAVPIDGPKKRLRSDPAFSREPRDVEFMAGVAVMMRRAREEAGMSRTQVARAMGASSAQIYMWETGRSPIRATALRRFALAIGAELKLAFEFRRH